MQPLPWWHCIEGTLGSSHKYTTSGQTHLAARFNADLLGGRECACVCVCGGCDGGGGIRDINRVLFIIFFLEFVIFCLFLIVKESWCCVIFFFFF